MTSNVVDLQPDEEKDAMVICARAERASYIEEYAGEGKLFFITWVLRPAIYLIPLVLPILFNSAFKDPILAPIVVVLELALMLVLLVFLWAKAGELYKGRIAQASAYVDATFPSLKADIEGYYGRGFLAKYRMK